MHTLLLAVLSSACMAIVLKVFRAGKGNRFGIILGNYLTCILISLLLMPDKGMILHASPTTLLCGVIGGVLFVAGLMTMQTSTRLNGAMLTSAFSRLGLLLSLAISIAIFGERPSVTQIAGIALVIAAVALMGGGEGENAGRRVLPLLLLTLVTCGGGDAMAKIFERVGVHGEDTLYFFYLFLTAAVLSIGLLIREGRKTGKRVLPGELLSGVAVGIPNYFSSYLLLRSLLTLPAFLVYPIFSTGAILIVMAVSALCFGERLTRRQWLCVGLILCALVLLNV